MPSLLTMQSSIDQVAAGYRYKKQWHIHHISPIQWLQCVEWYFFITQQSSFLEFCC